MIETERLLLRRWQDADRDAFAAMSADPEVMAHFPAPLSRAESDLVFDRLCGRWRDEGICFGVVERRADGAFLGIAGLAHVLYDAPVRGMVEIGWRLGRAHWGKGYASEAARGWLGYGFGTLGFSRIVAFTVPANLPSQAVMRRIGMRRTPELDFEHPLLEPGHPLRSHVVFALDRPSAESAPA